MDQGRTGVPGWIYLSFWDTWIRQIENHYASMYYVYIGMECFEKIFRTVLPCVAWNYSIPHLKHVFLCRAYDFQTPEGHKSPHIDAGAWMRYYIPRNIIVLITYPCPNIR